MWAAERVCGGRTFPPETEFTGPPTAALPGNIWDFATGSRSQISLSIRRIPIAFLSPYLAILTDQTQNAVFSVRLTLARHGKKFCTRMTTPAPLISRSILRLRKLCMRIYGLRDV